MQRGKVHEPRGKGNPCGGKCSSNRASGRGPRRRPRDGRDRAVGGVMVRNDGVDFGVG